MNRAARPEGNRVHFWCPGCEKVHGIHTNENGWTWNGSLESPTFTPSVLVRWSMGNYLPADDPNFRSTAHVCHSFVTDGHIQFLGDCTHAFANKTVDLPPWPYGDDTAEDEVL